MKMSKAKIAAYVAAAIIGMGAITGCNTYSPGTLKEEYGTKPAVTQAVEQFSELEGRIMKVQPSNITYVRGWGGNASTASNHEFEYVIMKDNEGKMHTLLYPYSKAILEGEATVKYRPLSSNSMDVETFIDTFIMQEYTTDNNFIIEAEGIITKDGIKYK